MARVICGECGGKGIVANPDMVFSDPESSDAFDCGACDGEGWVEVDDEGDGDEDD